MVQAALPTGEVVSSRSAPALGACEPILIFGSAEAITRPLSSTMTARSLAALGSLASVPPTKPEMSSTGKPCTSVRTLPSLAGYWETYSATLPFVSPDICHGAPLRTALTWFGPSSSVLTTESSAPAVLAMMLPLASSTTP